ncbi:hypothetical protein WICMUC_002364 [Wickerhamomyces mucosus]|uniref:Uncharacterized protein n=1 Tax=Wickerhamomyces mucosus TaxID=1378264 RepID=A0A9P8PPU9_9ASCO|nr:hypothetical protein WICMUC_002364 [Wickerhamomyces mucosus]
MTIFFCFNESEDALATLSSSCNELRTNCSTSFLGIPVEVDTGIVQATVSVNAANSSMFKLLFSCVPISDPNLNPPNGDLPP